MRNPLTWVAIKLGSASWLHRYAHLIVKTDLLIGRVTRGRMTLLTFVSLPQVYLTVAGRKSGIPRTTPLLCAPTEDGWLVAGSNWGGPKPPAWVGNLAAIEASGKTAKVDWHGKTYAVTPVEQTEASGRDGAWRTLLSVWPNYALYEQRTARQIRVFLLRRV
ncbi:MAG: nitroreductase family deazaflavin-dependent oxidoreductase [Nocardioides sp.]|jgi:deazaflavin-dependent oxidoreductase (nitroreductase family)